MIIYIYIYNIYIYYHYFIFLIFKLFNIFLYFIKYIKCIIYVYIQCILYIYQLICTHSMYGQYSGYYMYILNFFISNIIMNYELCETQVLDQMSDYQRKLMCICMINNCDVFSC